MNFRDRFSEKMRQPDDALAISFEGRETTWREIRDAGVQLDSLLNQSGVDRMQTVGVLSRNRPGQAAVISNLIDTGRCLSIIYTMQSAEGIARDIEKLRLPAIVGSAEDWSPEAIAAARNVGSVGLCLPRREELELELVPEISKLNNDLLYTKSQPQSLGLLSSGTTGKPKRIDFPLSVLDRLIESMSVADTPLGNLPLEINFHPLSGMGGMMLFLGSICRAGAVCLLERYQLGSWLEAIEQHRPSTIVMPAAVIRDVLDEEISPERLRSVTMVWGGSAPLDPDLQDRFEEIYDIPIIWGYGATEFAGTAASWTPALREQFGKSKRGSVGRPFAGISVRLVDPETGVEKRRGEEGLLEAKVPAFGEKWIRTTDVAVMDEDDFIFLKGRADQAIIRGGFKVLPESITDALLDHPAVKDAMAGGIDDRRLGQVPIAAVELAKGSEYVTEENLLAFLRTKLVSYAIPAAIYILPSLPRTGNMKANIAALAELGTCE